jgi:SpoIIAA-like
VVVSPSCSPSGLVAVTLAGAVTRADERALVNAVHAAIKRFGTVRVLIRVHRYAGPHHEGRFDPEGLWAGADVEGISRIAIVGEPAWKTVPASSHRRQQVPIEYFATEQAARRWLFERCPPLGYRPITDTRGVKRRIPR